MDSVEGTNGTEGIYSMRTSGTEVFWKFTRKFGIVQKEFQAIMNLYRIGFEFAPRKLLK